MKTQGRHREDTIKGVAEGVWVVEWGGEGTVGRLRGMRDRGV